MSAIYRRHECTTLEEVNALALTDGKENGSYVISPTRELCWWSKTYAVRNEPTVEGDWSYQDGYGGASIHFPLHGKVTVTVLEPISVEDLIRDTVTEALAEQARQEAEADKKRQEFNDEVRRLLEEKYLGDATARVSGFTPHGEA